MICLGINTYSWLAQHGESVLHIKQFYIMAVNEDGSSPSPGANEIKDKMSRNKDYQRLLNTKRWKELRAWKLQQNPLCEMCQAEGYVRAAVDVHHIRPVESAHSVSEMEQLCYDIKGNTMSLCIPCHVKVHKEMGKNKKENVIERKKISLQRWIQKNRPSNGEQ